MPVRLGFYGSPCLHLPKARTSSTSGCEVCTYLSPVVHVCYDSLLLKDPALQDGSGRLPYHCRASVRTGEAPGELAWVALGRAHERAADGRCTATPVLQGVSRAANGSDRLHGVSRSPADEVEK